MKHSVTLKEFINSLSSSPTHINFETTMAVIDAHYLFVPTAFINGKLENQAGENTGSCKIFAFAKLHHLTETQTLSCFGKYYQQDVLQHPADDNHQNIRNFMQTGWGGLTLQGIPL
ncbi:MAG: HopJ type III effector protein, partial [Pseudomonadales bacterium]|nr:HopJ type III effector protein [Pseudomonadales bacterium]